MLCSEEPFSFFFQKEMVGEPSFRGTLAKIMSGKVANTVPCTLITPCATYSHFLGHFLVKWHLSGCHFAT